MKMHFFRICFQFPANTFYDNLPNDVKKDKDSIKISVSELHCSLMHVVRFCMICERYSQDIYCPML